MKIVWKCAVWPLGHFPARLYLMTSIIRGVVKWKECKCDSWLVYYYDILTCICIGGGISQSHNAVAHSAETDRSQVSVGTAALLEYLAEQSKEEKYTFCLGADAFLDLTAGKWKESERVLQLLQGRCLVLHRAEEDGGDDATGEETTIDAFPTSTTEKVQQKCNPSSLLVQRVASVPGAKLLRVPTLGAVSSSKVRDAIAAGDTASLTPDMIHPDVLAYILDKGLYQVPK